MTEESNRLDEQCISTIRMLAADMVEKANSGHPGLPLGAAPMAYVLWTRFLKHNPANPKWYDRDRFILSAGHGSALLYALLHLTGYDLPLSQLRDFRQWESMTPGHPEYGQTPGVEATTGPLGQGFAMGVGMAMAESFLADSFNRPGFNLVDHYTYALVSDGDLMEGVAAEAASLAGTLGLNRLIYLYDDNGISIEGSTDFAFTEDVSRRFQAYGWQVIRVSDGNDLDSIETAINNARAEKEKPSLVMVKTHIGFGSPKQDLAAAHGEPLGAEAMAKTKEYYGWNGNEPFFVSEDVGRYCSKFKQIGQDRENKWEGLLKEYGRTFKDEAARFKNWMEKELPVDWEKSLIRFTPEDGPAATRAASGKVINSVAETLPNMLGGSADLAPSNKTWLTGYPEFGYRKPGGRNIHFGVREHAMGAIVNGMALHGGVIPYGGTFLVFSDYMRPSIRLAALMKIPSIFVFTHDSIGVGEDGPTHQPIEHLASLRAIPGLTVFRPADANETSAAWELALKSAGPSALLLTRQKLPVLDASVCPVLAGTNRGAYILADAEGTPEIIIMASGSEVHLALAAKTELDGQGHKTRVVSMPSWELFSEQSREYRDEVLPPAVKARLAVEAGVSLGWRRWVGTEGDVLSIDRFGVSAPGGETFKRFGFTKENVAARARALVV